MMRNCTKCGDYYADDSLAFCLADGMPLVNVDPLSESWNEGARVVEEKARALGRRRRRLRWRRALTKAVTMLMTTVVVCVVAVNGLIYLGPEAPQVATGSAPSIDTRPAVADNKAHVDADTRPDGNADGAGVTDPDSNTNTNADTHPGGNTNHNTRRGGDARDDTDTNDDTNNNDDTNPADNTNSVGNTNSGDNTDGDTRPGGGGTDTRPDSNVNTNTRTDTGTDTGTNTNAEVRPGGNANSNVNADTGGGNGNANAVQTPCTDADKSREREAILGSFDGIWRRGIEAERRNVIAEATRQGAEPRLGTLEYETRFFKKCAAAFVTVRYAWQVSSPAGSMSLPKSKRFACLKFRGVWFCS